MFCFFLFCFTFLSISPRIHFCHVVILPSQLAPLAAIVLKVKLLDMGDPRSLLSSALSPPNIYDIVRTVLQLKMVREKTKTKKNQMQYEPVLVNC